MIIVNDITSDYSKFLKYELKDNFIPAYINKYSGMANVMTDGVALFFKAGTNEPKTISIYLYHKELQKVIREEKVESLRFRAGKFLFWESIGNATCMMGGTGITACYPDSDYALIACFTPVADDGADVELYDTYFFINGCNGCILEQIYEKNNITLKNWSVAYWDNVPRLAMFSKSDTTDNTNATNIVSGGSFNNTVLDLFATLSDGDFAYKDGQIRDFNTYLNKKKNFYYQWYSSKSLYGYKDIQDKLTVVPFTDFDAEYINIESSPKNYLLIEGAFLSSDTIVDYKALTIRLDGAFALRQQKNILISFVAKNMDLNVSQQIPMSFSWREIVNEEQYRAGDFDVATVNPTDTWAKYTVVLQREVADEGETIELTNNSYTEIQIKLPTSINFKLGITNVFAGYNMTAEIPYPRDNDYKGDEVVQEYRDREIYNNIGQITARLDANDTATTINADGRIIYADSVYTYNYLNDDGSIIEDMPSYRFSLAPLYKYIVSMGYPDGNGDDYVTYSDISTGIYTPDAVALNISGIFEWNKPSFNPSLTVSTGSETVFEFEEFHRGLDFPQDFWYKTYKGKDDVESVLFTTEINNYVAEFIKQGGDTTFLGYYNRNTVQLSSNKNYPYFFLEETGATLPNSGFMYGKNLGFCFTIQGVPKSIDAGYNAQFVYSYCKEFGFLNFNSVAGGTMLNCFAKTYNDRITPDVNTSTIELLGNDFFSMATGNRELLIVTYGSSIIIPSSNLMMHVDKSNFPSANPSFAIKPNNNSSISQIQSYNRLIANDPQFTFNYKNPNFNVLRSKSAFNLLMPTIIRNSKGFVVKLKSDSLLDYRDSYFYFECKGNTRAYKVKKFENGVSKIEDTVVPDELFCFYFYTGTESAPKGLPDGYRYIKIDIMNAKNGKEISKIMETTINTYRVAIPNLKGCILKGSGISEFENAVKKPNQIPEDNVFSGVFCRNLRNIGYKKSKSNVFDMTVYGPQAQNDKNQFVNPRIRSTTLNPNSSAYNEAHINFHISIV